MIFALNRTVVIMLIVTILAGAVSGLAAAGLLGEPAKVWGVRGALALLINILLLLLNYRPILRFVHRVTFGKYWWFPWLDGQWEAEIRSNWPRVKAMLKASRTSVAIEPMTLEVPESEELTMADVSIRATLLGIRLTLQPRGTRRSSKTLFVRPQWMKPNPPELAYVFEQIDDGPVAVTDARKHYGAARLEYDEESDTLRGPYWTERRGDVGFNTAGSILLKRVP